MQQFAAQGDHLWTRLEIWIYFEFQAVLSELEWTSVGFNEPQRSLSQWVSGAENLWGFNLRLQLEASTFRRQVKELNKVHLFCETLTLLFQLKRRWSLLVCGQRALKEPSKSCLNALTSLDILRPIPAAYPGHSAYHLARLPHLATRRHPAVKIYSSHFVHWLISRKEKQMPLKNIVY